MTEAVAQHLKVTVLMPVYNGEAYLKEAITSILDQTFTDFELLIINDGSTDKSVEIIEGFKDKRIRLVHNEQNMNLVPTLNRGLELARGEYIARMDADDIALAERFARQVKFLDENPDIALCGTWIKLFGNSQAEIKSPTNPEIVKATLLFTNCIAHPTVMFRRQVFLDSGLHYETHLAEDYTLWKKASMLFPICNLPEILLNYRISSGSYSQVNSPKVAGVLTKLYQEWLAELGLEINEEQAAIFKNIGNQITLNSRPKLVVAGKLLRDISKSNHQKKLYNQTELVKIMWNLWQFNCQYSLVRRSAKILTYLFAFNFWQILSDPSKIAFVKTLAQK